MKKFEKPEMEVIVFEAEDIITTSLDNNGTVEREEEYKAEFIMEKRSNYDLKNSITKIQEEPTTEPTAEPTEEPTVELTVEPIVEPIAEPTEEPTVGLDGQ